MQPSVIMISQTKIWLNQTSIHVILPYETELETSQFRLYLETAGSGLADNIYRTISYMQNSKYRIVQSCNYDTQ